SRSTSWGPAPFCGPYTAAAPSGPTSGFVTSVATTTRVPRSRASRPERSSPVSPPSPAPPPSSRCPPTSRAPRAPRAPEPPSVQATPPTPTTISRQPRSSACRTSSPTPPLCARSAVSGVGVTRTRPHACAASTYAVPSPTASRACTGPPNGPVTRNRCSTAPADSSASTVPSPPSATGTTTTSASGSRSCTASVMTAAACSALRVPLNLSGATTTRRTLPASTGATLPGGRRRQPPGSVGGSPVGATVAGSSPGPGTPEVAGPSAPAPPPSPGAVLPHPVTTSTAAARTATRPANRLLISGFPHAAVHPRESSAQHQV